MGTTAYGGKGSKGRALNGDWSEGVASCRLEQPWQHAKTFINLQTPSATHDTHARHAWGHAWEIGHNTHTMDVNTQR